MPAGLLYWLVSPYRIDNMQEMLGDLLDGACQEEGHNPLVLLSVATIDPGDMISCLGKQVFLNPQAELSDLPLKSFYRYSLPDISASGMFLSVLSKSLLFCLNVQHAPSKIRCCCFIESCLAAKKQNIQCKAANRSHKFKNLTAHILGVKSNAYSRPTNNAPLSAMQHPC